MKSEAVPRTGIVDALGTGLVEAARRPWLWAVPIVVDLVLWLAPRLSITALINRLMAVLQADLLSVVAPGGLASAQQRIELVQAVVTETARQVNLGSLLMAGWFAPPSAVASAQVSRYFLFSDAVLAPARLGPEVQSLATAPWQTMTFDVTTLWGLVALAVPLWLVGHLLTGLYFTLIARDLESKPFEGWSAPAPRVSEEPFARWLRLVGCFAAVSLFASVVAFMLRLPLGLVTTLAIFTGSGATGALFVVGGGITLWLTMWFLSSLYFAGDALAFHRQPLVPALMQSLVLVRANGFRALILATLVNTLLLGARALWGLIGGNPAGAIVAIVVNGYLATAMTIGIYVYYLSLRRRWQNASAERQLGK